MEILSKDPKQLFKDQINELLDDMQASFDDGTISNKVSKFQLRLDALAKTYQKNDSLGRLRYKLYEAQAYLHYMRHDKEKALTFIDEAVRVRGEDFEDAKDFRQELSEENKSKGEPRIVAPSAKLPIDGWLAFFAFAISIGVIYNTYQSLTGWDTFNSLTPDVNAAYPNFGALLVAERVAVITFALVGVTLVYLVIQRKRIAREVGILFLATNVLWAFVDYSIATNMFANNSAALDAIKSSSTNIFIVPSLIWTVYLFRSKQVKATLNQ